MVNFCYAYPIIFDNDGAPLRGRLDFCEPGTTTSKNVFDVNGNSLGSSIDTTDEGFPGESQIFIDGATDCRVYKGDELQYVMRLVDVSSHGGTPSGDSSSVGSIEDLRRLSVPDDGTTVTSTGYYVPGDMTPQLYVFSVSSTADDDGGGVVKPDDVEASAAGRWLLVPQKYIDCRAFGIMPVEYIENIAEYYSLSDFFDYLDKVGRDAWFPSLNTEALSYYVVTAGAYTCHTAIHVDRGVRFRNTASGNTISLTAAGIDSTGFKFSYGTFNISCPVFRTSWKGSGTTVNYTPSERLIVDDDVPVTSSNVIVEFVKTTYASVNLTGCEILCSGKLSTSSTHSFTNCRVTDRYFTNPSNVDMSKLTLSGCFFEIDDFYSVSNWAKFNMAQGNGFLDFRGKSVSSLNLTLAECGIRNASIESVTIQSTVQTARFYGCAINSMSGANGNLIFDRSSVKFTNSVQIAGSLTVLGGSVSGSSGAAVECSGEAVLDGCQVDVELSAKTVNARGCQISEEVTVNGDADSFSCTFVGNIFSESGTCVLDSSTGATANGCVWKDNHFGGASMGVSLAHFANGNSHTYVYEGNTGECMPSVKKGVFATSNTVTNMTEGWKIFPGFSTQPMFILGTKSVRVTLHSQVTVSGCTLGSTNAFTISSGYNVNPAIGNGALVFPDIVTELNVNVKDSATSHPQSISSFADIEVL